MQKKGEPLHPEVEDWLEIRERLMEIGGDAFSWQYLQGHYTPQTQGQRAGRDKDGNPVMFVGSFDPKWVTSEEMNSLRESRKRAGIPGRSGKPARRK